MLYRLVHPLILKNSRPSCCRAAAKQLSRGGLSPPSQQRPRLLPMRCPANHPLPLCCPGRSGPSCTPPPGPAAYRSRAVAPSLSAAAPCLGQRRRALPRRGRVSRRGEDRPTMGGQGREGGGTYSLLGLLLEVHERDGANSE